MGNCICPRGEHCVVLCECRQCRSSQFIGAFDTLYQAARSPSLLLLARLRSSVPVEWTVPIAIVLLVLGISSYRSTSTKEPYVKLRCSISPKCSECPCRTFFRHVRAESVCTSSSKNSKPRDFSVPRQTNGNPFGANSRPPLRVESRWSGSNRRQAVYKTATLPLSYTGVLSPENEATTFASKRRICNRKSPPSGVIERLKS